MKIKLKKDKSIRGQVEKAGTVVDVSDGVAQWLIERGDAEAVLPDKKESVND